MPLRVLAALVALLLIPATASASYDGSTGKVAYVDTENGLFIDDPYDDQPAQGPLATVATEDVQTKAFALPSPPAWSPDGTLLAYSAPVDDSYGLKHSAIFVMKADGTGAHQVSHPFALEPDTCDGQCDNGHASYDHSADLDAGRQDRLHPHGLLGRRVAARERARDLGPGRATRPAAVPPSATTSSRRPTA